MQGASADANFLCARVQVGAVLEVTSQACCQPPAPLAARTSGLLHACGS